MFSNMCQDSEDDCRSNAVFGLGEVLLWAGEELSQQKRQQILMSLSQMLKIESEPRVIDNIIGAVARAVIADITNTPVDDIITAVLANLPLKDDKDEYDIIFKLFTTLFSSQHQSFSRCLPKIIECSAIFFTDY